MPNLIYSRKILVSDCTKNEYINHNCVVVVVVVFVVVVIFVV